MNALRHLLKPIETWCEQLEDGSFKLGRISFPGSAEFRAKIRDQGVSGSVTIRFDEPLAEEKWRAEMELDPQLVDEELVRLAHLVRRSDGVSALADVLTREQSLTELRIAMTSETLNFPATHRFRVETPKMQALMWLYGCQLLRHSPIVKPGLRIPPDRTTGATRNHDALDEQVGAAKTMSVALLGTMATELALKVLAEQDTHEAAEPTHDLKTLFDTLAESRKEEARSYFADYLADEGITAVGLDEVLAEHRNLFAEFRYAGEIEPKWQEKGKRELHIPGKVILGMALSVGMCLIGPQGVEEKTI